MTIALAVLILILAYRFGPRHKRTAGDIVNESRRPMRAWPEYRSSSVASPASPPVRGDATDLGGA